MRPIPLVFAATLAATACAKPGGDAAAQAPGSTPRATPEPAPARVKPPRAATPTPSAAPDETGTKLTASRAAEEACVDKWLAERKLDPYGSPEGTLYAGGTPLFNERTGEQVDRLDYVYKRQPLAREACRPK